MSQRAVIIEISDEGYRSVTDILEWESNRLDLNKRRLMRIFHKSYSMGKYQLEIFQLKDNSESERIYFREIDLMKSETA